MTLQNTSFVGNRSINHTELAEINYFQLIVAWERNLYQELVQVFQSGTSLLQSGADSIKIRSLITN